jgi:hypothetical protein
MQHLFAVPWSLSRRTLHGIAVVAILVFGFFAILKSTSGGREVPAKELVTGSIPRASSVPKPPPNDPMAAFLSPTQLTTLVQRTAVDRRDVPLPRPRPKRL